MLTFVAFIPAVSSDISIVYQSPVKGIKYTLIYFRAYANAITNLLVSCKAKNMAS